MSSPHGVEFLTAGPALLQAHDLCVAHDLRGSWGRSSGKIQAVNKLNFRIHSGRIFGLVGESGCGKTSLAKTIVGLNQPSSGTMYFAQNNIASMDATARVKMRQEIQYLFQDPLAALSPRRTIRQSLAEPLRLYGIGDRDSHRARIEAILKTVDLSNEILPRYPHELSGGQRQRVLLARALVAEPKLIIADEPLSSLDVSVQARMIALIQKVRKEMGIAFLLISHDLAVVQQLADEVAIMYLGHIVEAGPASRIFSQPAHPYTKALFDAVPGGLSGADKLNLISGEPPSALTPPAGCVFHTRCPGVMEVCRSIPPKETPLAESKMGKHSVRCHLWNS
jgi:oligopeptide/dipeptide ABC transporter ATP-binding protein